MTGRAFVLSLLAFIVADAQPLRRERVANRLVDGLLNVTFVLATDDHPEDLAAELDAKMTQLEKKTEAELAKMQDASLSPLFSEVADMQKSIVNFDAKLKQMETHSHPEYAMTSHEHDASLSPLFSEVADMQKSIVNLDAKLKQMETHSHPEYAMKSHEHDASLSPQFSEVADMQKSIVNLDAKLKQMEMKTPDALLSPLFLEVADMQKSIVDLNAKLEEIEEKRPDALLSPLFSEVADLQKKVEQLEEKAVDRAKRIFSEAVCCVRYLIRDSVPGGGASELAAPLAVAEAADTVYRAGLYTGLYTVEQYTMRAFVDTLYEVPLALAENSGFPSVAHLVDAMACTQKGTADTLALDDPETCASKVQLMRHALLVLNQSGPSSFVAEGSQDSFADFDAELEL